MYLFLGKGEKTGSVTHAVRKCSNLAKINTGKDITLQKESSTGFFERSPALSVVERGRSIIPESPLENVKY